MQRSSNGAIRVVEFGGGLSGATAGALFAATGADVIRVVDHAHDAERTAADEWPRTTHQHADRHKRAVDLDLSTHDGAENILRLCRTADIVICCPAPGKPSRSHIFNQLAADPARPVRLGISTFGSSGPRSSYVGSELCAQASGGYALLCGEAGSAPLKLHGDPFQRLTGVAAFIWGHAAVHAERAGAAPAKIDLSVEDTVAANLEYALALYSWMGLRKERGVTYPFAYPHDLFDVSDGQVEVSLGTRDAMLMFGIAIDAVEIADVDGLSTEYGRALRHREFDDLVAGPLLRMSRHEFFERATEVRMPAGYVVTPHEIADLPPVRARGALEHDRAPFTPLTPVAMRSKPRDQTDPDPDPKQLNELIAERPTRRPRHSGSTEPQSPLSGIKVLDLTLFYAGPTATRILAELGAEVIRVSSVQSPGRGLGLGLIADYTKGSDPWNGSFYYYDRYAGKREITLDLTSPDGMELLLRALEASDVLVTNYSPRALGQMGLDADTLQSSYPRLVVSAISGYGATGPWADRAAVGPAVEALCGIASTNGYEDGPPTLPGTAIADAIAGYWAAAGALQKLHEREQTGVGGFVDVSMLEGCLSIFPEPALRPESYVARPRWGNDEGRGVLAGVFPCSGDDRWIAIEVDTNDQWTQLASVLGIAHASDDREERRALVATSTPAFDAALLEEMLQGCGVAAVQVRDARDLLVDRHLWDRSVLTMVDHPNRGRRPMSRQLPGVSDELAVGIHMREPMIGEHNVEVLGGRLGLSSDDLERLESAMIIGCEPASSWEDAEVLDAELVAGAGLTKPLDPGYRWLSERADAIADGRHRAFPT